MSLPQFNCLMRMNFSQMFLIGFFMLFLHNSHAKEVITTEVFVMPIQPALFNWTMEDIFPSANKGRLCVDVRNINSYSTGSRNQGESPNSYQYRASFVNLPDLPSWLNYESLDTNGTGFVYGVPPLQQNDFKLQVVGLNKKTYETKTVIIDMDVVKKDTPAMYEVQMKIDNLNVEYMFDPVRQDRLLKIFTNFLWPQSSDDLYITFLASAVKLGARRPLDPREGEGVVIHIGSSSPFSDELLQLQDEVRPLMKLVTCPRDFKRTKVDRHFRPKGFVLDWCSFRLKDHHDESSGSKEQKFPKINFSELDGLVLPHLSDLPSRAYLKDMFGVLIAPFFAFFFLLAILSFIMCFTAEDIHDPTSEIFFDSLFSICEKSVSKNKQLCMSFDNEEYRAILRATNTLRSMSHQRELEATPRAATDLNEDVNRPSPPPYSASRKMVHETEPKTWYC